MIGNDASKYRSLLELSYPTSEGIVKSWEDMDLLMKYSFDQVRNYIHLDWRFPQKCLSFLDGGNHESRRKQGRHDGVDVRKVWSRKASVRNASFNVTICRGDVNSNASRQWRRCNSLHSSFRRSYNKSKFRAFIDRWKARD